MAEDQKDRKSVADAQMAILDRAEKALNSLCSGRVRLEFYFGENLDQIKEIREKASPLRDSITELKQHLQRGLPFDGGNRFNTARFASAVKNKIQSTKE